MDQPSQSKSFGPDASIALGQLLVKLRNDGLFSNDDVQAVLRKALASAAPAISASLPTATGGLATWPQSRVAAE